MKLVFVVALVVGMFAIAILRTPAQPPKPSLVIVPDARATATTSTSRPRLGVECIDLNGYHYRAEKCR